MVATGWPDEGNDPRLADLAQAESALWPEMLLALLLAGVTAWALLLLRGKRRATAALAMSNRRLREIVDGLPHLIFVKDEEGRFLLVNQSMADAYGLPADALIGRHQADVLEDQAEVTRLLAQDRQVIATGRTFSLEQMLHTPSGRTLTVQTTKVRIRLSDTQPRFAVLGIAIDVTAARNAERRLLKLTQDLETRMAMRTASLEAANRDMAAFSYSVSHDLRAPLRSIEGFSRHLSIAQGDRLDESGRHYLERIRAGVERMGRLIDDLLYLAQSARRPLRPEPVDLSRLAETVTAELRERHPNRTVTVDIRPHLSAAADRSLVAVVFENLLGNAWKYTGKQARAHIEVGADERTGETVFFVRDNGAGFDMTYADKLFAPFQRLHQADEFEGTGIGLATVATIIRRHGGRIWAEGEIDRGACFYFTLGSDSEHA